MDEKEIYNTVSVDGVVLAPDNVRHEHGTEQSNEMPDGKYIMNEYGIDKNGEHVSGELTVHCIVKHVRNGKRTEYVIQWYWCRPDADNLEQPNHIPQHFTSGY